MSKRVELPEAEVDKDGELMLKGNVMLLLRDHKEEIAHRCNHYMELAEALDNAIKAWDVFYPDMKPQDAAEDAEFGPLLTAREELKRARGEK